MVRSEGVANKLQGGILCKKYGRCPYYIRFDTVGGDFCISDNKAYELVNSVNF